MRRFVTFLFGILIAFSVFAFPTHVTVDMHIDGQVFFNIDYEQVDNSYRPYLIMDDAYAVSPEFYMISEETYRKEAADTPPVRKNSEPAARKRRK